MDEPEITFQKLKGEIKKYVDPDWKKVVPEKIIVSTEAYEKIVETIENPPSPNEALVNLMKTSTVEPAVEPVKKHRKKSVKIVPVEDIPLEGSDIEKIGDDDGA